MRKRLMAAGLVLFGCIAAAVCAAELPRKSPEFAINLLGGKQLPLSQYRGKAVVLAFILTTCPHCQKTIGFLNKDQNEFGPRGLQVLASAIEGGAAAAVPGFVQTFNPPFPVGFNTDQNQVLEYLQHPPMFMVHMPVLVFIDREGTIRAQYEGDAPFMAEDQQEQNIRARIEELLKPAAAGKKSGGKRAAPKKAG